MSDTITPVDTQAPSTPSSIVLTEEQNTAVEKIITWLNDDSSTTAKQFKLGGYAGTGKTTIIKSLLNHDKTNDFNITCAAFTGKAVSVLHRKQISAQTLHSLMYDVVDEGHGEVRFVKKSKLLHQPDLIIVDEASMVSQELYNDLLSFNIRYLFVGDPGQLEPVGDNPQLMLKPDVVLSKIHRQAEQSPIIRLATAIRNNVGFQHHVEPNLDIRPKRWLSDEILSHDQVICARNKTRINMNLAYRQQLKYPKNQIVVGDKLIILRNNLNFSVFNGLLLKVTDIITDFTDSWLINAEDEIGTIYRRLPIWKDPFVNPAFDPKKVQLSRRMVYADFGYVITCHKSQGSEWNKVFVIDEWMPPNVWDMARWRYTAVTRAAQSLTFCV